MNNELILEIAKYFCIKYPHSSELSQARLTKMVYLADWVSAVWSKKQITKIEWMYHMHGPFVNDVVKAVESSTDFSIESGTTAFGDRKRTIQYSGSQATSLDAHTIEILDYIIKETEGLYWKDFINLVYGTYPIRVSATFDVLNLVALAKNYNDSE